MCNTPSRFSTWVIGATSIADRLQTLLPSTVYVLRVVVSIDREPPEDEKEPGIILDCDAIGNLVSLEILDASRRVAIPTRIEYQVGSPSVEDWSMSRRLVDC